NTPLPRRLDIGLRIDDLTQFRADEEGISNSPRRRLVLQDCELQRQLVAVRLNKFVYPSRIVFEELTVSRVERSHASFDCITDLQISLLNVMFEQFWTEYLGQFAGGITTGDIHLPQTVLSCDVSLRKE